MEEAELYYALYFDFVAKCYNRDTFEAQSYNYVAIADLDSLKWLNGNYDHRVGDEYLQRLAAKLQREFGYANVFRLSGDEFVVISDKRGMLTKSMEKLQGEMKYFSFGVTPKLTLADNALKKQKAEREELGLCSERGERPPWYKQVEQ